MTLLAIREELEGPYSYVVSADVVSEVKRLLESVLELEAASAMSRTWQARGSILRLQGLGKEIWNGVDPKKYIHDLRNEWDAGQ